MQVMPIGSTTRYQGRSERWKWYQCTQVVKKLRHAAASDAPCLGTKPAIGGFSCGLAQAGRNEVSDDCT